LEIYGFNIVILNELCVEIYGFNIVILNEFSTLLEAAKRFSVKETDTEEVIKVDELCNQLSRWTPKATGEKVRYIIFSFVVHVPILSQC